MQCRVVMTHTTKKKGDGSGFCPTALGEKEGEKGRERKKRVWVIFKTTEDGGGPDQRMIKKVILRKLRHIHGRHEEKGGKEFRGSGEMRVTEGKARGEGIQGGLKNPSSGNSGAQNIKKKKKSRY